MAVSDIALLSHAELTARRAQVLASVGNDEESLRDRASDYALTARELAALDEIETLDYLLGAH